MQSIGAPTLELTVQHLRNVDWVLAGWCVPNGMELSSNYTRVSESCEILLPDAYCDSKRNCVILNPSGLVLLISAGVVIA